MTGLSLGHWQNSWNRWSCYKLKPIALGHYCDDPQIVCNTFPGCYMNPRREEAQQGGSSSGRLWGAFVEYILGLGCLWLWYHPLTSNWNVRRFQAFQKISDLHYEYDGILTNFQYHLSESVLDWGEIPSSPKHKFERHMLTAASWQHQDQTLLKVPQEVLAKTHSLLSAAWTQRAICVALVSTNNLLVNWWKGTTSIFFCIMDSKGFKFSRFSKCWRFGMMVPLDHILPFNIR